MTETTTPQAKADSKVALWIGRVLSWLVSLLLLLDGVMKLIQPKPVVEATTKLGYPESVIFPLGIVVIVCTLIYLLPRSAILGAILLTGYMGGAVASHLRAGDDAFSVLMPIVFAVLVWLGIYLQCKRLRAILPFRR